MTFTYSATTITPPSPQLGCKVIPTKWQNRYETEGGTLRIYRRATVEWFIEMTLRCTYAQMIAIRNFFKNTVYYSAYSFTFTPDSNMDAGAGLGTAITVNLLQDKVPEDYIAPGIYKTDLILRAVSSGSGSPS